MSYDWKTLNSCKEKKLGELALWKDLESEVNYQSWSAVAVVVGSGGFAVDFGPGEEAADQRSVCWIELKARRGRSEMQKDPRGEHRNA